MVKLYMVDRGSRAFMKMNRSLSGKLRTTRRDFLAEGAACAKDPQLKFFWHIGWEAHREWHNSMRVDRAKGTCAMLAVGFSFIGIGATGGH